MVVHPESFSPLLTLQSCSVPVVQSDFVVLDLSQIPTSYQGKAGMELLIGLVALCFGFWLGRRSRRNATHRKWQGSYLEGR